MKNETIEKSHSLTDTLRNDKEPLLFLKHAHEEFNALKSNMQTLKNDLMKRQKIVELPGNDSIQFNLNDKTQKMHELRADKISKNIENLKTLGFDVTDGEHKSKDYFKRQKVYLYINSYLFDVKKLLNIYQYQKRKSKVNHNKITI